MTERPIEGELIPAITPGTSGPRHLPYLDGLRGLSALYIVLFHLHTILRMRTTSPQMPQWIWNALGLLNYGHSAVCVFIALSGYLLMLPVARSEDNRLRGGVLQFLQRRALRILPPYYVALLLFSGLILLSELGRSGVGFTRSISVIGFLEHAFLVHNLSPTEWFTIDAPLWSLATEWQIYLAFALLVLPLYRRIGYAATLLLSAVVSLLPHFLWRPNNLDQASPWFLTVFILGMIGARWSHGSDRQSIAIRHAVPWGAFTAAAFALFLILQVPSFLALTAAASYLNSNLWISDFVCGVVMVGLLMHCSVHSGRIEQRNPLRETRPDEAPRHAPLLLRILNSRFAVGLGVFSYSLYLIHQPIIGFIVQTLQSGRSHLPPVAVWVLSTASLPFVVGLGYLFYLLVERRFVRQPARVKAVEMTPPAEVSSAASALAQP